MEITVGIDVSKSRLDVFIHPSGRLLSFANDQAGVAALAVQLGAVQADGIGLEATGGYERLATAALAEAGLPVVVLNPAQVRHYAKALGQRAPRPMPSMPSSSHCLWPRPPPRSARYGTSKLRRWLS